MLQLRTRVCVSVHVRQPAEQSRALIFVMSGAKERIANVSETWGGSNLLYRAFFLDSSFFVSHFKPFLLQFIPKQRKDWSFFNNNLCQIKAALKVQWTFFLCLEEEKIKNKSNYPTSIQHVSRLTPKRTEVLVAAQEQSKGAQQLIRCVSWLQHNSIIINDLIIYIYIYIILKWKRKKNVFQQIPGIGLIKLYLT